MKLFILLISSSFLLCCGLSPNYQDSKITKISYSDFRNILTPRSAVYPLSNGLESLVLIAKENDKYAKIYKLEHDSKKLSLIYDAGRPIRNLSLDSRKNKFYFLLDEFGDENTQIYSIDPESKEATHIFGSKGNKSWILDFSHKKNFIYIASNKNKKNRFQVFRYDLVTKKIKTLTDGTISFYSGVVDPNDHYFALERSLGNNNRSLYILNLLNDKLNVYFKKKGYQFRPAFFHPAKLELFINSDSGRDRMACAKILLSSPFRLIWVREDLTKDLSCTYDEVGKFTVVNEQFEGRVHKRLFKSVFEQEINFSSEQKARIHQIKAIPQSNKIIYAQEMANQPTEYFIADLTSSSDQKPIQVTKLNRSGIAKDQLGLSYDEYYPSFDGKKIHGIMYARPEWIKQKRPKPLIIWPHGGPDSYEGHFYKSIIQYFVLKGFIVFAPNFRGSSGYGRKFETLNDKDWGGGHIKDLIFAKKHLEKRFYVNEKKIYILGGSFGGYSTLSTITQYPDEFQGAVAIVAVANLFTFLKSIPKDPAWQSEFLAEVGDPKEEFALLKERSPYFYADKIQTPLLIFQAENDVRTIKAEMDNFVAQLKEFKIPVEYVVLEKEGHALQNSKSLETVLEGSVQFLNKLNNQPNEEK